MLGVKNVFRKDYNSIGPKLLFGIQQNFDGVDEAWLLKEHNTEKINVMLRKKHSYSQKSEHMVPTDGGAFHDRDMGSYGIPDLSSHK